MPTPSSPPTSNVWCRLRFEHDYFRTTRFAGLVQLLPVPSNRIHGVHLRDMGDAFWVHGRTPPPGGTAPASLGFGLEFLDPDFLAYTALDYGEADFQAGNVVYLNPACGNSDPILARTAPRLPVRPRRFHQALTRPAREVARVSARPFGGVWEPMPFQPTASVEPAWAVNLEGFPSCAGELRFEYRSGDVDAATFYVFDSAPRRSCRAAFEWIPPRFVPGTEPPTFTVRFEVRSTIWRYFITGLSPDRWPTTSIRPLTVAGVTIPFEVAQGPATSPNGRPALVLQSARPIPLCEAPPFKVVLQSQSVLDGQPLPLPGKQVSRLIDPAGNAVPCSDVFVDF